MKKRLFHLKYLVVAFLVVFFIGGGYVGYLAALVDQDEISFLERVQADTDKERLERQLARAKSILEARERAYIRRSQEFIREKRAELSLPLPAEVESLTLADLEEVVGTIIAQQEKLNQEGQETIASLQEERQDLTFFEDEVDTIEQILARIGDDEELKIFLASERRRRRISDSLRRLFELLDKRKELALEREIAKESYNYWERYPQEAPRDILITVHNKGNEQRSLNPVHVSQISTALAIMPQGFDNRLRTLYIVYGDPEMRRGLSGLGVVFMKGEELDFFRVLVHEFGHIQDLHREVSFGEKSQFYDGQYRLFQQDPSVEYYSISWANTFERTSDLEGYASSYGSSDPFEDFAEAFALYVLQGETFLNWQLSNTVIQKKYQFISDAYSGRSFPSTNLFSTRPYDVTMLTVSYEELLSPFSP